VTAEKKRATADRVAKKRKITEDRLAVRIAAGVSRSDSAVAVLL
jgi:hypothetical protein